MKIRKLQRLLLEEPSLKNYIAENSKLRLEVSCLKTKQIMVKDQLKVIGFELGRAKREVDRLIRVLDTKI